MLVKKHYPENRVLRRASILRCFFFAFLNVFGKKIYLYESIYIGFFKMRND